MISIVKERAARKIIKNFKNVVVVHSSESCAVCKYFIPEILLPIINDPKYKDIKFLEIQDKMLFPVQAHPVTYFFRNGKNVTFANGSAPDDKVRTMLDAFYINFKE